MGISDDVLAIIRGHCLHAVGYSLALLSSFGLTVVDGGILTGTQIVKQIIM